MHALPESRAVQLAQRGDAVAFERLYELHSRRVFALCLRMLKNTAEAEDSTQEVFLQVFRKIQSFRGDSAFSTWLHRVAANVALMRLRGKTPVTSSLDDVKKNEETAGTTRRELGGPDPNLEGVIDRQQLDRAIDDLPPRCKLVFILYDIQGYAHREIAKITGCSVGNAKSQLHKARMRLRGLLRRTRPEILAKEESPREANRAHIGPFLRSPSPLESA